MSASFQQFESTLADYLKWNRRANGPLLEGRARRLRYAIFKGFAEAAPSAAEIDADIDAALAAGGGIKRAGGSVAAERRRRKRSRKYLASSFIFPGWKGKPGVKATFTRRSRTGKRIGGVEVNTAGTNARIAITSLLEGAVALDADRGIVDNALRAQEAEMKAYIARKQAEQLKARLKRLGGTINA